MRSSIPASIVQEIQDNYIMASRTDQKIALAARLNLTMQQLYNVASRLGLTTPRKLTSEEVAELRSRLARGER